MSRRRGEFEHRTSIFEGAYRAWSHLGGCDANLIRKVRNADGGDPNDERINNNNIINDNDNQHTRPAQQWEKLDPILFPHDMQSNLQRMGNGKGDERPGSIDENGDNEDQSKLDPNQRFYPYEPLPRKGLSHPFVQAIVTVWIGHDIDTGLKTLRTWWQHRRKGITDTARTTLSTKRMAGIVDGYTRHFFQVLLHMVEHGKEQPPLTVCRKLDIAQTNSVKEGREEREQAALKSAYYHAKAATMTEQSVQVHATKNDTAGQNQEEGEELLLEQNTADDDEVYYSLQGSLHNASQYINFLNDACESVARKEVQSTTSDNHQSNTHHHHINTFNINIDNNINTMTKITDPNDRNASVSLGALQIMDGTRSEMSVDQQSVSTNKSQKRKAMQNHHQLDNYDDNHAMNIIPSYNNDNHHQHHHQNYHHHSSAQTHQLQCQNPIKKIKNQQNKQQSPPPPHHQLQQPQQMVTTDNMMLPHNVSIYDSPTTFPIIAISSQGHIQLVMKIDGMESQYCVRMIESVLMGLQYNTNHNETSTNSNRTSYDNSSIVIPGLLDIIIDLKSASAMIKIAKITECKQIIQQISKMLKIVGYACTFNNINVSQLYIKMKQHFPFDLKTFLLSVSSLSPYASSINMEFELSLVIDLLRIGFEDKRGIQQSQGWPRQQSGQEQSNLSQDFDWNCICSCHPINSSISHSSLDCRRYVCFSISIMINFVFSPYLAHDKYIIYSHALIHRHSQTKQDMWESFFNTNDEIEKMVKNLIQELRLNSDDDDDVEDDNFGTAPLNEVDKTTNIAMSITMSPHCMKNEEIVEASSSDSSDRSDGTSCIRNSCQPINKSIKRVGRSCSSIRRVGVIRDDNIMPFPKVHPSVASTSYTTEETSQSMYKKSAVATTPTPGMTRFTTNNNNYHVHNHHREKSNFVPIVPTIPPTTTTSTIPTTIPAPTPAPPADLASIPTTTTTPTATTTRIASI